MGRKVFYDEGGVQLLAPILPGFERILTHNALQMVGQLARTHLPRWKELRRARTVAQSCYDEGVRPDFDPDTRYIRDGDWRVADIPEYLLDRTVEVVCPSGNRKMLLGALNSKKKGAPITLGDLEDANTCNWGPGGTIDGLNNLYDASRGSLDFEHPTKGRRGLDDEYGWLMVRPRGLHFVEPRVLVDDDVMPAFIFDTGLHLYHNGLPLKERGQGADLYIPKLEHGSEAAWCDSVISDAEMECDLPEQSAKVSVLFEHILGALQIDEIMYAMRNRFVAGNTGWLDYLASLSRTMRYDDTYVMPDPGQMDITTPCMDAYLDLVVSRCHQRGAMAIGGTATQVAVPGDPQRTEKARRSVLNNAAPYIRKGFDGGWVVYAPFAPAVAKYFKENFTIGYTNQRSHLRQDVHVTAEQLLEHPAGTITLEGLDECIVGGVSYYAGWLGNVGAVAIVYEDADGNFRCRLMEDAATGQRKREDVWKWLRLRRLPTSLVIGRLEHFLERKREEMGADEFDASSFSLAGARFWKDVSSDQAPPDYFPPELLQYVVEQENEQFARSS